MKYKDGLILILILTNILIASYIAYSDFTHTPGVCLTGAGCSTVQSSPFGSLLGLKVSYFGLASFLILLAIWALSYRKKIKEEYFVYATIIGSIFALYFISLQLFVIKAICFNCMVLDSIMIIIAILASTSFYKRK